MNNYVIPDERINISAQVLGLSAIKEIFSVLEGLDQALELTAKDAITIDLAAGMVVLSLTDHSGEVVQWRERLHECNRGSIIKALAERGRGNSQYRPITEDIIRLKARREHQLPQAWQYQTQPLVRRLIKFSGHEPAKFLKACGLKPGKIHNLAQKPPGEVTRTIKAETVIPIKGEIKKDRVLLEYAPLGGGVSLHWLDGIDQTFALQLPQPLPEILQDSLIDTPAANLVDDERMKAVLGDMTVTSFGPFSNGHQLRLSQEDEELMDDIPDWVEHHHRRLCQRLDDWAAGR